MPRQLDQIDLKILRILQEKGRISNVDLSKEVDLSPAPTLERVRKLEKLEYIEGYHAEVNQKKMGINVRALIQITIHQHQGVNLHEFIEAVMKIPEVIECYQVTGDYDYLLQVVAADIQSLDKLITNRISKIPEVGQIKSHIVLSVVKQSKVVPNLNLGE